MWAFSSASFERARVCTPLCLTRLSWPPVTWGLMHAALDTYTDESVLYTNYYEATIPFEHGKSWGRRLEFSTKTKLQYAQRSRTPTGGAKSVEISLHDLDGREILLKENAVQR